MGVGNSSWFSAPPNFSSLPPLPRVCLGSYTKRNNQQPRESYQSAEGASLVGQCTEKTIVLFLSVQIFTIAMQCSKSSIQTNKPFPMMLPTCQTGRKVLCGPGDQCHHAREEFFRDNRFTLTSKHNKRYREVRGRESFTHSHTRTQRILAEILEV